MKQLEAIHQIRDSKCSCGLLHICDFRSPSCCWLPPWDSPASSTQCYDPSLGQASLQGHHRLRSPSGQSTTTSFRTFWMSPWNDTMTLSIEIWASEPACFSIQQPSGKMCTVQDASNRGHPKGQWGHAMRITVEIILQISVEPCPEFRWSSRFRTLERSNDSWLTSSFVQLGVKMDGE